MKNYRYLLLSFSFMISQIVFASDSSDGLVAKFLNKIIESSPQSKIQNYETKASLVREGKTQLIFKPVGFFEASYTDQDSPQTSPFSTSNTEEILYGIGVEKQWEKGFKTDLSYRIQDRENTFFNGASNSFIAPTVELSITTNLIQDILHKRYYHLSESSRYSLDSIELNNRVNQKEVLTRGLLSFSDIVELQNELALQKSICGQVKSQSNKLKKKRERLSISKREYLLSSQELLSCQILIEQLNRNMTELKDNFESTYGFTYESFKNLDSKNIYKELQSYYKQYKSSEENVDVNKKDEIQAITQQVKALESKQLELSALAKTDLALEFRTGATGLSDSFGDSHDGVRDLKFPFIYMGLKIGLPFNDRAAEADAAAGIFEINALEEKKKFVKQQSLRRFNTLKKTLENDFNIYDKYNRSLGISKEILKEARNDFNNGRIDYVTLTDFNTKIIEEQKKISSHRSLLLIRLIEYLDYYQFFNRYF